MGAIGGRDGAMLSIVLLRSSQDVRLMERIKRRRRTVEGATNLVVNMSRKPLGLPTSSDGCACTITIEGRCNFIWRVESDVCVRSPSRWMRAEGWKLVSRVERVCEAKEGRGSQSVGVFFVPDKVGQPRVRRGRELRIRVNNAQ